MNIIQIDDLKSAENRNIDLKTVFNEDITQKGTLIVGTASIPPGARVPTEGEGRHEGDEYSILFKGTSRIVSGGREYRMSAGEASFIPAGEAHWSLNDGEIDCELVWILVNP